MASTTDPPSFISVTTVLSLLSTVAILLAAYLASLQFLPKTSPLKIRLLFIWHAFDALIHFILEGSYLYNCFFSYTTIPSSGGLWSGKEQGASASQYLPRNVYFLGIEDRVYGSEYGTNPFAKLWMEYAKADARWGGSDLTIISLELLTVFIAGPLAVYICNLLRKQNESAWFWMVVLATGELYGGFMTFAPEWLSGNPNLDASNWMYLWLYLVFFNAGLWVVIPGWILWEAYGRITRALALRELSNEGEKTGGKGKKKKT